MVRMFRYARNSYKMSEEYQPFFIFMHPLIISLLKDIIHDVFSWNYGCYSLQFLIYIFLIYKIIRLPTIQQEVQQRKLLYMGLYLLIWGEAANLRFMPECLCYIYHHVCRLISVLCCLFFYTMKCLLLVRSSQFVDLYFFFCEVS